MRRVLYWVILLMLITLAFLSSSYTSAKERSGEEGIIYQEADKSIYDRKTETWYLKGNVKVYYKDGVLFCDEMKIDLKREIAWGKGNVRVVRPNAFITSQEVELRYGEKLAIFKGDVQAIFKREIEGRSLRAPLRLYTPWLRYDTENEEGYTDKGVTIYYKEYIVSAPVMWWSSEKGEIILEGGVKGTRGEDEFQAQRVIIYTEDERVQMEGGVKIKVFYNKEKEELYRAEYREETSEEKPEEIWKPSKREAIDRLDALRVKLKSDVLKRAILQEDVTDIKGLRFSLKLGYYLKDFSRPLVSRASLLISPDDIRSVSESLKERASDGDPSQFALLSSLGGISSEKLAPFKALELRLSVIMTPGIELISGDVYQLTEESEFQKVEDLGKALQDKYPLVKGMGYLPCLMINRDLLDKVVLQEEVGEEEISQLIATADSLSGGNLCLALTVQDFLDLRDLIDELISDKKLRRLFLYVNAPSDLINLEREDLEPLQVDTWVIADYRGLSEYFKWGKNTFSYTSPELKDMFYETSSWLALKLNAGFMAPPSDILSPSEGNLSEQELLTALTEWKISGTLLKLSHIFKLKVRSDI